MKKTQTIIGLLLLGVVLAGGAKSTSALSFECGACVDEPSFVGYTTAEVSGSLLTNLGGVEGKEKIGFQYATSSDFGDGFGFESAIPYDTKTMTWDNEIYTTNYYKHKLSSLDPGVTYYYRFVTYGPNPPVLENGDFDFSATRLVSETLSFTTKPFPVFSIRVYRGMSAHEEVKNLQETLSILNHYGVANPTPLVTLVDGKFGPITETAVKAYQSASGLVADGIVGAKTRESLNKLMASWFTSCVAPCTVAGGIPFGTGGVSSVTSDSGTLVGYTPNFAQPGTAIGPYYYFEYGTTESFGEKTDETLAKASGELAIPITELEANTTYYYRFVQKSGSTMMPGWIYTYGTTRSFTTSE